MTSSIYKIQDVIHSAETVDSITVNNGGIDFSSKSTVVTITSSSGSGATAEVTKITGAVTEVIVTNTNSDNDVNTQSSIPVGGNTDVTLATRTSCQILKYKVDVPGGFYDDRAFVTIGAPDLTEIGVQATASLEIGGSGQITAVITVAAGRGYSFPPTVTIFPGGSGGANAEASVDVDNSGMEGDVFDVRPTVGGSGYQALETLTITGYESSHDTTPSSGGEIDVATVDGGGKILTLNGASLVAGTNYRDGEIVTLTGQTSTAEDAVATISVTSGMITAVSISNGGTGYESDAANTVVFANQVNPAAVADAVVGDISGTINTVTVTNGGSGYLSADAAYTTGSGETTTVNIDTSIPIATDILEFPVVITNEMVSPGGGGILRLYFSFEFNAGNQSIISVFNNNSFKGNLNADNSSFVNDAGYYRFDIDVEANDSINFQSSVIIDTVNFVRTHLVQFGA